MADGEEGSLRDKDALMQSHKREKRELQARIQELKNAVPKGDKKRRKEVAAEVARLEQEMEQRHSDERSKVQNEPEVSDSQDAGVENLTDQMTNGLLLTNNDSTAKDRGRVSKAQKRRDKKAAAAVEREALIAEQEVENLQGARHLEEVNIRALLRKRGLQLHQIPADGNCLYQAVIHQLALNKENSQSKCSDVPALRCLTANQMRKDMDNYLPFLTNPQSGDPMTSEEFETYCSTLETTNAWGGHIELRAISESLHMPIEVIQASGPTISLGEDFLAEKKPLTLSYHRHTYSLGEHYNSVVPRTMDEGVEEASDNFETS